MSAPALTNYQNGYGQVSGDSLNTFEQTCDTVVQLRAFIGISGLQVYIRGFTSVADGGQGTFYWSPNSTATDDGGIAVVAPSGAATGRWIRMPTPDISVANLSASTITTKTINSYYTVGAPASQQGISFNGNLAMSGNSITLNSGDPSSLIQIPLSGSVTIGDTITVHFLFSGHNYTISYTTKSGDTLSSVATGLANAAQATPLLYVAPSITNPGGGGPPGQLTTAFSGGANLYFDYDTTHTMTMSYTVSGAATEVLTIPTIPTAWDANPLFILGRNTGLAPASGSNVGQIVFQSTNSASPANIKTAYCSITATVSDSTVGSLNANLALGVTNETHGQALFIGTHGMWTANASGTSKGDDSLTVGGEYYLNGNDIRKTISTGIAAASGQVISGAAMVGGVVIRSVQASATDTTATAAQIVAAISAPSVDVAYLLKLTNQMAGTWAINAGSGVTLNTASGAISIPTQTSQIFYVQATNVTSGSEAVVIL